MTQENNAPVKVWAKKSGRIEMYPNLYFAVKNDGTQRMSCNWADCLEFLVGKKVRRAQA